MQRKCYLRWLVLAAAAAFLPTAYTLFKGNETTKDFYDVEREGFVRKHVKRTPYDKVHVVEGEAAGGGERVGGADERPEGGVLSLNGDDEAGDYPGDAPGGDPVFLHTGGDITSARPAST